MKRMISALLAAVLVLSLCACGSVSDTESSQNLPQQPNSPQAEDNTSSDESSAETEIVIHEDVVFSGSGDNIISMDALDYYYAFYIEGNDSGHHFSVTTYDSTGAYSELLVNTTDPYVGVTYDQSLDVQTIEVKADGDWEIRVMDFNTLPDDWRAYAGETFYGNGDLIVFVDSGTSATIVNYAEEGHFAVISYDEAGWYNDLLANEVGTYSGTVKISSNTAFVAVKATGDWDLTINK